jgi:hypothetical protein
MKVAEIGNVEVYYEDLWASFEEGNHMMSAEQRAYALQMLDECLKLMLEDPELDVIDDELDNMADIDMMDDFTTEQEEDEEGAMFARLLIAEKLAKE